MKPLIRQAKKKEVTSVAKTSGKTAGPTPGHLLWTDNRPESAAQKTLAGSANKGSFKEGEKLSTIVNGKNSSLGLSNESNSSAPIQRMYGEELEENGNGGNGIGLGMDFKSYLSERKRREREDKIRRNAELVSNYTDRYYSRRFAGRNAVIVSIIKKINYSPSDYGVSLCQGAIQRLNGVELPPELSPEELINGSNSFKEAVERAYDDQIRETSGNQDTQLGLQADYVDYK